MLLKKLINHLPAEKKNIKIHGLSTNSKKIQKGFIFFAINGRKFNGERFIDEAILNGASVIICSKNCKYRSKSALIIKKLNVRHFLSEVSSKYYKLKPNNIIAVTGTNGKTSVADLFYQILNINKIPVAYIGTLGVKFRKKKINTDLTSPDPILIHKILENIKKNKIENVIIEASSHGLNQHRIDHINLKAGVFTNFSQDHLDYHKNMKNYLNSKLILFNRILSKNKSVISDKFLNEFKILKKISKKRGLRLIDINSTKDKLNKIENFNLNDFQLKNLSMAIEAAKILNLSEKKILSSIKKIKDVDGRFELIKKFPNGVKVYVDFAHTPDALLKALLALKEFNTENISLVFGCGGDRDFKKRPLMAKIASQNCKKIYVTDDNPRNEKPESIRKEIIKNIKNKNCFNIGNRAKAIKTAILDADPNEIILVAGKGHENEQIYKNKILKISDKQIIREIKFKKKKNSINYYDFLQNKKIMNEIKSDINVKNFHGIAIDTRVLKKNNLFLTIKGKNNNGVKFIPEALKKGAKYIISSKTLKNFPKKFTIKVKNELNFLNNFAILKRKYSTAKIVAITGSAGKTSLKNLISELLKIFGKTFCSPKSYNNHYGVPLSLSLLSTNNRYGVFEVGMSKAGEINKLSKMIKPHIGIITNVGEAHIENFKNLKGIAKAKGEIINNIQEKGTIILNRDDKYYNYFAKRAKIKNIKIVSFGMNKKSDIFPIKIFKKGEKILLKVKIKKKVLSINMNNMNILNALSSLALLKVMNLNFDKVIESFNKYELTEGRGKVHKVKRYKKNFILIDESYNANPLSVKNAIKNFNSIKKNKFKKYLLLGDMLELGKKSGKLHKNISKVINNSDIDKVFIKGNKTLITYKNINKNKRGNIFQVDEDIDFTLNNIISDNDYLMIKGSNATGLNNISKKMIKGY